MNKPPQELYAVVDGHGIVEVGFEDGEAIYQSLQEAQDYLLFMRRDLGQLRNAKIYCYTLAGGPYK